VLFLFVTSSSSKKNIDHSLLFVGGGCLLLQLALAAADLRLHPQPVLPLQPAHPGEQEHGQLVQLALPLQAAAAELGQPGEEVLTNKKSMDFVRRFINVFW
jgi:hypothetical protein